MSSESPNNGEFSVPQEPDSANRTRKLQVLDNSAGGEPEDFENVIYEFEKFEDENYFVELDEPVAEED